MSRNVLERLLHQLCIDRATKQRFKEDAAKLLERHNLTEEERRMLVEFDVAALQQHGVNPMLTMGFWQENSPSRSIAEYMKALNPHAAATGAPVFSAALKQ